jgi:hypothetical protein
MAKKKPPVEYLSREELLVVVRELERQIAELRRQNQELKRAQHRQAAPFSKGSPVSNPKQHFVPTSGDPNGECEYANLLYACATCNETKQAIVGLPNPCHVAFNDCLQVMPDGYISALNAEGEKLKLVLRLDSAKNIVTAGCELLVC